MSDAISPSDSPGHPRSGSSGAEAAHLFAGLAAELEEGRGDPEALFAAHPALEGELRALYRGWLAAAALFREMAADESLVGSVRREIEAGADAARAEALLARLARTGFETRYEVGEVLGRGGMGEVRRVTERVLGRELAMKVVRPVEPGRRARLLLRFLEEAEVIGRLEHPGIVPIHELGLDTAGQVYFTMPLVRGRTLAEILRLAREGREGWTRARVLEVVLKACDAVAYAHSRGVLHRDLKPANVMVGRFGEVYVMDWGLARSLGGEREGAAGPKGGAELDAPGALTLDGEVLGTPAYMAPEQAAGRSTELDERCDVYALGAILYELVTGTRPYGERSSAEALASLERAPPPAVESLAPEADDELCAIVRRAMARAREERYASVATLAADLRAFLEGRVVRAHRTGAWIEARKWVQRNRRLAGALGLALVALAGGLATSLVLMAQAERERANVFRLVQGRTLADLIERAQALWPAHPERIPELEAWQAEARALVRALDPEPTTGALGLRGHLAAIEARADTWDEEDRWWHDEMAELVTGIEALNDPETGLLGTGHGPQGLGIAGRLALAERLRRESERPEVVERWRRAADALRADPRFDGLVLTPQVGLVPLGRDARSGLEEFAHLLSGEVPLRNDAAELELGAASALVLVLLPPGEFWMGSQADDPAGPNYAAYLLEAETPAHVRRLPAFFLGKHELTQGQWECCTGTNPSYWTLPEAARLPVESVTWLRARAELVRLGLRLPGEAEWEYACRAGTTGEYFWGPDPRDAARHANVKDRSAGGERPGAERLLSAHKGGAGEWLYEVTMAGSDYLPIDDGFMDVAPIGSLQPNRFGLHDMIGNVWEWCEDVRAPYAPAGAAPAPSRSSTEVRVLRGGAYYRPILRSAERNGENPDFAYQGVGVRAARSLER